MGINEEAEAVHRALRGAAKAWGRVKKLGQKMWVEFTAEIGPPLVAARALAMRQAKAQLPKGRGYNEAFSKLLWNAGLHEDQDGGIDRTTRSDLFFLMEHLPDINEWRAKDPHAYTLNHPTRVAKEFKKSDAYRAIQIAKGELPLGEDGGQGQDGKAHPERSPPREKPTMLEEVVALKERVRDLEGQLEERTQERDQEREERPGSLSADALRAAYADHLCRLAREREGIWRRFEPNEVNTDLLLVEDERLQSEIARRWMVEALDGRRAAFAFGGVMTPGDFVEKIEERLEREDEDAEPEPESETEAESEPEQADAPAEADHVAPSDEWVADGDDNPRRWQWVHGNLYEVFGDSGAYRVRFKLPNSTKWRQLPFGYSTAHGAMLVAEEHGRKTAEG
jgi:hypothetical protein